MSERRRQVYTDKKLQGYLIATLIALQVGLVIVLLLFLYSDIYALIEQQLYRIHSKESGSWPEIFSLLVTTMSIFLVSNVVILYLAHDFWGRYIKGIIRQFSRTLDRIIGEDFSTANVEDKGRHRMLDLVQQWYELEYQRNRDIKSLLNSLSDYRDTELGPDDAQKIKMMLNQYRQVLSTR